MTVPFPAETAELAEPVAVEDPARYDAPTGTSGKAIASLILGFLSACLGIIAGIPAIILGVLGLIEVDRSRGRLGGKGLAIAGLVLGLGGSCIMPMILIALLLPAVQKVREAATRIQSANNLKQLATGMYGYHEAFDRFPPAVQPPGAAGKPAGSPYSWRVAVLPYVEQEAIFRRYHTNEPWDGPTNRSVLTAMPRLFAAHGAPSTDNVTHYQVFVGPGTVFDPAKFPRGSAKSDIVDLANTILIVEAEEPVAWTRPADLSYSPDQPLPALGGITWDTFQAAFADGSVRRFSKKTDERVVRAMITRKDVKKADETDH
jgi:hypothetical protein